MRKSEIVNEIMKTLSIPSEEIAKALTKEETRELKRVLEARTSEEARSAFYACSSSRSEEAKLALEKWSVFGIAEAQAASTVEEATRVFFSSFVGSEGRKRAIRKIAELLEEQSRRWWEDNYHNFVRDYPNEWAAVSRGKLVAHSPSRDALDLKVREEKLDVTDVAFVFLAKRS